MPDCDCSESVKNGGEGWMDPNCPYHGHLTDQE